MEKNLFEIASRKKYRFDSHVGQLSVENLWDLPLTTERGPSLDSVARATYDQLRNITGTPSFVDPVKENPLKVELENKMKILEHIIEVRRSEIEAATAAYERSKKRKRIQEALAALEDRELSTASQEELLSQLRALNGEDA